MGKAAGKKNKRKEEKEKREEKKEINKNKIATHLIINSVKLGEEDTINNLRVITGGMVSQSTVELHQLVHRLIPYQSLTHKQCQVWLIHQDQL